VKSFVVVTATILLVLGFTRPGVAASSAELLVAVAILAVTATATATRTGRTTADPARPFAPPEPDEAPTIETPDVGELLREIERSRGTTPPLIARHLRDITRGRLADHHHLDLDRDADRTAIAQLLSPALASIAWCRDDNVLDVPLRTLPRLLDELETL
jgi:hypothetical protein